MSATRTYVLWLVCVALGLLASVRGTAQARSELYYTGMLAGQPIQMDLTLAAATLSGSLLHETDGRENNLKGQIQPDGTGRLGKPVPKAAPWARCPASFPRSAALYRHLARD